MGRPSLQAQYWMVILFVERLNLKSKFETTYFLSDLSFVYVTVLVMLNLNWHQICLVLTLIGLLLGLGICQTWHPS